MRGREGGGRGGAGDRRVHGDARALLRQPGCRCGPRRRGVAALPALVLDASGSRVRRGGSPLPRAQQGMLMRVLGIHLRRAERVERAAALGVVFGLNVPACAAPLLAALMAASLGVGSAARGFFSMAVFGLALSLPLVAAVAWSRGRGWLHPPAAAAARRARWQR